jgi:hypothetical protein
VFRVVASQPWPRGQQVFISYGSGSNDTLLQLYGFVEANNRDDRFIVRSLPAVLTQLGCAGVDRDAALSEVSSTCRNAGYRQGVEANEPAQWRMHLVHGGSSGAEQVQVAVPQLLTCHTKQEPGCTLPPDLAKDALR